MWIALEIHIDGFFTPADDDGAGAAGEVNATGAFGLLTEVFEEGEGAFFVGDFAHLLGGGSLGE